MTIQELIDYLQTLPNKTGSVLVTDGGEDPSEENQKEAFPNGGHGIEFYVEASMQYDATDNYDLVLLYKN